MTEERPFVHPYIPNSVPEIKAEMLQALGISDAEVLYSEIPDDLRLKRKLTLPEPLGAESDLKRHVTGILSRNTTCEEYLSFLGGGCWQHYVPAVCDEITQRSEFLTSYHNTTYANLGKYQTFFEFQSQMGELVGMDVVSVPTYSWGAAAGNAIRMASRMTGRNRVLISETVSPERLATIRTFCQWADTPGHIQIELVGHHHESGMVDVADLESRISPSTAAVYFENPSYLGVIESQGQEISEAAHVAGAVSIVGVDPISLGVLAPPADYGADIVVGTAQPLGVHMECGGGTIGFIASRDEEEYVAEYPSYLLTITDTIANFVMAVRVGNLLFLSGHGPYDDGTIKTTGKLGQDLSVDEGYQVARNVGLNCLSSARAALGSLDKIKRFVKVLGMVNCTEDFKDQPKVVNGCSDLMFELFGEAGKHARSAVGMQGLPNNIPVEIEMIIEVE